jgi:hypothetical protein
MAPDAIGGRTHVVAAPGHPSPQAARNARRRHADTPTTTIEHDDRLLTVKELAERLGRRPRWVYANADALGAIRVGEGKHPQLHFQLPIVRARLAELAARPPSRPPRRPLRPRRPAPPSRAARPPRSA